MYPDAKRLLSQPNNGQRVSGNATIMREEAEASEIEWLENVKMCGGRARARQSDPESATSPAAMMRK